MIRLTGKCLKILKTCNLYLCFLALGMSIAVPGPCLLDLQNLMRTDTQKIAFIYTARYIGYVMGSLLGGIILDKTKSKETIMTISNLFSGTTMLAIPWSPNLIALACFMVMNGLALGITDTGSNVICLRLWGSESGPYYQGLHFNFGFGALMAPLIAAPFLSVHKSEDSMLMNAENATNSLGLSNFTTALLNDSCCSNETNKSLPKIIYPFSAIGIFCLLVGILFSVVSAIAPTEDSTARVENKEKVNQDSKFTFPVIILNFILLFLICGTEIGYAQMLTTHVVKGPLQLTSSTGSYMTSMFWASFCLSRLISVFLAIKFSNLTLIVSDLVITAAGAAVLLFLSSYEWSVWVSSVLLGAGMASFFASAVGWVDNYIAVTNKMIAIFTVGAAIGQMFIPFIISYFMEILPKVLIYVVPVSCILAIIVAFVLYMILRRTERRVISENSPNPVDNDLDTKAAIA